MIDTLVRCLVIDIRNERLKEFITSEFFDLFCAWSPALLFVFLRPFLNDSMLYWHLIILWISFYVVLGITSSYYCHEKKGDLDKFF